MIETTGTNSRIERRPRRGHPHWSQPARNDETSPSGPSAGFPTERGFPEAPKELQCLYNISRLVEHHGNCESAILQGITDLLPPAWRYPEICCVRLSVYGHQYSTANFEPTPWRQSAHVLIGAERAGVIEVGYLERRPPADEGPFLARERGLLELVAERTGRIVQRIRAEHQLELDRNALQEANTALRKVLDEIEQNRKAHEASITANVQRVIMPTLHALEREVPAPQKPYVALLRKHLEELTSPFARHLCQAFAALSPAEIEVCSMIRNGLSTKDIAQIRHVSRATIAKQRERIRKKLRLTDTDTNLSTYLRSFASSDASP